jgi:hypothetical protein
MILKRLEQQGMVEVKILSHLKNLDKDERYNLVHIKEYFYFRNHLCITFELLGYEYINLFLLKFSNTEKQGITNFVSNCLFKFILLKFYVRDLKSFLKIF